MQNQSPFNLFKWMNYMKNVYFNEHFRHLQFKPHFWICFFFLKIKKITNEIQNFPFVQRKQPCALKLRFKFPSRMPHCVSHSVCIFVWNVFHWCLVGSAVASLPVNLLTKRTLQSQKTDSSVEWNVWFNQAVVQRCVCVHARLLSLSLFLLHPCVPKYTHGVVCAVHAYSISDHS